MMRTMLPMARRTNSILLLVIGMLVIMDQLGIAIEQGKIHEELQILSRTDALTGMLTRRAFIDEAGRRFGQARRYKRAAAVLYIDLNNFKLINDRFGHRHGDKAIRAAADRVNGQLSVIEKVRKFDFADEAFTIENEQMTPSMKIRRHVLREIYADKIAALYKA